MEEPTEVQQPTKTTFRKKVVLPSDKDETLVKLKPKAVPAFEEKKAHVKLNKAAILAEEARIRKVEAEENKQLEGKLLDLRDSSEFDAWQREMREKDEIERLEHIQMTKIEMELTREAAIQAFERKNKQNQLQAAMMKEEFAMLVDEKEEDIAKEQEVKKALVIDTLDNRYNGVEERKKIQAKNLETKQEIKKELAEAIQQRKEEEQIEQEKRDELIRQIRELESQPIARQKGYDPTEVMGFGLFDEMSLAQLRERLEEVRIEQDNEKEMMRAQIQAKKEAEQNKLVDAAHKLTERRNKKTQEMNSARAKKQEELNNKKRMEEVARKKGLMEAYDRISSKKKKQEIEQKKLEQELKEIRLKRQYLKNNKNAKPADAENQAKKNRELKQAEEARAKRIKAAEANMHTRIATEAVQKKGEFMNDYHRTCAERK